MIADFVVHPDFTLLGNDRFAFCLPHAEQHGINEAATSAFEELLDAIKSLLGINLLLDDISADQKDIIAQRQTARDNKDFSKSDELRDALKEQGLVIKDAKPGQIWSRV